MALPDIKVDDTAVVTGASGAVLTYRVVGVDVESFPLDASLDWSAFTTDTIVVKRRPDPTQNYAVTYTGAADVQQTDGKIVYYDAKSAVQSVDATASIELGSGQHMELRLKAGPIRHDQAT